MRGNPLDTLLPAKRQLRACDAKVREYLAAALADNTLRAYQCDLRHFQQWGGKIPATPAQVANYLAAYADSLAPSTLSRRVVALHRVHVAHDLPSPCHSALVRHTLQGIRRIRNSATRQVKAIQPTLLRQMVQGLTGLSGLRDRALLLIGFAGAFRRSELVSLTVCDLTFSRAGLVIRLRRSKTDAMGQGRDVTIPRLTGVDCPCRALMVWLKAAGITEGAVFRRVDREGGISARALNAQSVALIIKRRVAAAGEDPHRYSGHSLRAGFVTSAVQGGSQSARIREQTGHASDAMLQRYVRLDDKFKAHPLRSIL